MNPMLSQQSKITAEHLARSALVYVRQSSLQQVRNNLESQRRQYAFAEEAVRMGWSPAAVTVIDEDQGKSGAVAQARPGFSKLVSAVARSEVGLVLSLEVSRLARNDADWSHLVYLCRWTGTLIADEQGVYDPAASADRMVLGIRGQVSEMERDGLVHRMVEARWNKARRGEEFTVPPAGYDVDLDGKWVMTADEAVQAALRQVFEKFDELGSARQVFLWWCDAGLPFPVRRIRHRGHEVVWTTVSNRLIYSTLIHPIYAGVFAFGRARTVRQLDPETQRVEVKLKRQRAMAQWPVLIRDHHPAYITLDRYVRNQERLRANQAMNVGTVDQGHAGAPREGHGLLQGIVLCGHCSRHMYVSYGGERATRTLQYRCSLPKLRQEPGPECQVLGGKRIEALVVEAALAVADQAGAEAAALAGEQLRQEFEATQRVWSLQLEKAQYEAERAERQYMAVEPENRVVVRELERRWNARLEDVAAIRAKAAAEQAGQRTLNAAELAAAQALGGDLRQVWSAPTTTLRDKKRLLRALIQEVQLRTDPEWHYVRIVWHGGAVTDQKVQHFAAGQGNATDEDIIALVRKLATDFDDTQIARILNRQGRRSGRGLAFTKSSVISMRGRYHIPAAPGPKPGTRIDGPFTADEAARELGVHANTVLAWIRDGIRAAEQAAPAAPWRIYLTAAVRKRLRSGTAPAHWVSLQVAARRLGISKSLAANWVKTGKIEGVRTLVGKSEVWRINVTEPSYTSQPGLFDQIVNAEIKES